MKTGSKRRSGVDAGSGARNGAGDGTGLGVLDAPEPGCASETDWQRRERASPGTLQRPPSGFAGRDYGSNRPSSEQPSFDGYGRSSNPEDGFEFGADEGPYRARRGGMRIKLGRLPRSVGGRIVLGCCGVAVLGSAAAAIAGVRHYALHNPLFVVATSADIEITGDRHLSRDQVLSVFGDDIERNVFRVPLADRRAELEQLPWVAKATVMRLLPNQIRVAVTERTPVAFVRQGSQIGLVDASGVLLDMPAQDAGDPNYSFPVLTGISAGDPLSTRAARMDIYRQFLSDLDSTGQKYSRTISEVDLSNPEDVKALVFSPAGSGGATDILVHFGEQHFLARYEEFEQHLPEWRQQYPKLASADMRYDGQIVLEMQKGAAAPLAGKKGVPAEAEVKASTATKATADSSAAAPAAPRHEEQKSSGMKVKPVRARAEAGSSASNERMYAALAAARKAAAAKAVAAQKPAAGARTASNGGGATP
jgi:cell division protein FtsQ